MEQQYIEFRNISKSFVGVQALNNISFRAEGGQVTALLGENGAGKSTLLKVMSGDIQADEGVVILNGEEMHHTSPKDALDKGISVIYQERQLVSSLSVMENIFFEDMPRKGILVDTRKMKKEAQDIIDTFGLPIKATDSVQDLSIAHQQMVEIMKTYRRNAKVIAFDEPTASLSDSEIDILFNIIEKLKAEGKIILYVSHRLAELFRITDKVEIFKDGCFIKEVKTAETTERELIKNMVGRDLGDIFSDLARPEGEFTEPLLEVRNLNSPDVVDVSFTLHKGEVLGFSGLVGAGRTEVMRLLFGADPMISGEILIEGKPVKINSPTDAMKYGIALCPEDRKEQGLILSKSIRENISVAQLSDLVKGLFLDKDKEKTIADAAVERFSIKTHTIEKPAVELSGGNQQKVILGRWTAASSRILILDEPTKGIDVGTKAEIYHMVCNLARSGAGVIFISSELTEVLNVSDNIIVMHNGRITGRIRREDATEEKVLAMAMIE